MSIDTSKFLEAYSIEFGYPKSTKTIQGIKSLILDFAQTSLDVNLLEQATIWSIIYCETNAAMLPIIEVLQTVQDTVAQRHIYELQMTYWDSGFYGRGYMLIKRRKTYAEISRLLKQHLPSKYNRESDGFLVLCPDKLLTKQIAFDALALIVLLKIPYILDSQISNNIVSYIPKFEKILNDSLC